MLTKHNVYSAKVILFSDSTKGFIYYFTSEYVFSSFRGFQDRFSQENLDRSLTIIYMYYIVGDNPALLSGFPFQTYWGTQLYPYCSSTPPRQFLLAIA